MIQPEWGTKRACPKCATRFYDLAKDDPVTCIACGNAWSPEPLLKSKQPMSFDQPKAVVKEVEADAPLGDEDIDIEDAPEDDAEESDLGGEDDLAEVVDTAQEEER